MSLTEKINMDLIDIFDNWRIKYNVKIQISEKIKIALSFSPHVLYFAFNMHYHANNIDLENV